MGAKDKNFGLLGEATQNYAIHADPIKPEPNPDIIQRLAAQYQPGDFFVLLMPVTKEQAQTLEKFMKDNGLNGRPHYNSSGDGVANVYIGSDNATWG